MVNLADIRRRYLELQRVFPGVKIYYSVKANPAVQVLGLLRDLGAYFDIASIYGLDRLLGLSVPPARISYGNTIKKEKDIAYAYERGVRYYASDSDEDMRKIARAAPGSRIFFRIITEGSGADWPLSKKFGAHPDVLFTLILEARELGLDPMGLSFHVGSQQRDIGQWDQSIAHCRYLFDACREGDRTLHDQPGRRAAVPITSTKPSASTSTPARSCASSRRISPRIPPNSGSNRGAGWSATRASSPARSCSSARRTAATSTNGFTSTPASSAASSRPWARRSSPSSPTAPRAWPRPRPSWGPARERADMEVVLAGPTCDSMDILYQNHRYRLPRDLAVGDHVFFLSTGAYTTSYSSVEFNGFPP